MNHGKERGEKRRKGGRERGRREGRRKDIKEESDGGDGGKALALQDTHSLSPSNPWILMLSLLYLKDT